jgi:ligand-binding sensor domain-containing protein
VSECGRDLPAGNVHSIAFAPDGAAWVANAFALARFDGQKWTIYDKLVHYVVAAPDGSVWANGWTGQSDATYVGHLDGEIWTIYPAKDAYPGSFTLQAVTADGRVWGTTQDGRLAAFDGGSWTEAGSWTTYTTAGGLSLDRVRAVDAAPDGALWVATGAGVARYDGAWTVYPVDEALGSRIIGDMAFASDGSVWFGAVRLQPDMPD